MALNAETFDVSVALHLGAVEASMAVLMAAVNRLALRSVEAGNMEHAWFASEIDRAIAELMKNSMVIHNAETMRRLPFVKNILLEGLEDAKPGGENVK